MERDRKTEDWNEREVEAFERKLRSAMQHREAPVGLKQRVLARVRERKQAQRGRFWMLQRVAASVVLAAILGGFALYEQAARRDQQRVEQRRGEEAREQVMLALRITGKTFNRVNERLADNGR